MSETLQAVIAAAFRALNGNFPVYALRSGISVEGVSIILPAFAIGSIVFQYPLGVLSDKYGRRNVLLVILAKLPFRAVSKKP